MQDKVKQLRKTIVQPWGNVLFHHQKIYTTISLSYFTDTETHSRWEKLKLTWYAAQKLADSRKNWNLKVNAFDSYLPYQGSTHTNSAHSPNFHTAQYIETLLNHRPLKQEGPHHCSHPSPIIPGPLVLFYLSSLLYVFICILPIFLPRT